MASGGCGVLRDFSYRDRLATARVLPDGTAEHCAVLAGLLSTGVGLLVGVRQVLEHG